MKQYNRVCARINLDAIAYNMEQMKNRIGQEGRLIAVINTDTEQFLLRKCLRKRLISGVTL